MQSNEELQSSIFDLDQLMYDIQQKKKISEKTLMRLCEESINQLQNENNLQIVSCPVTVCGDIHGQFDDMLEIFLIGGNIPDTNYLFLGDYVNRGNDSIECISLLLALKLKYPNRIILLRGNHEDSSVTRIYGFYDECKRKYGSVKLWKCFNKVFEFLPLSAIIENEIFCVHAGLSSQIEDVYQINNIQKTSYDNQIRSDLLWNDPDLEVEGWNTQFAGPIMTFGKQITKQFLHRNNLKQIVRAHQTQMNGYELLHDDKIYSIFSCPNYCNLHNKASFIEFDDAMNVNIQTFKQVNVLFGNEQQIDNQLNNQYGEYNNDQQFQ